MRSGSLRSEDIYVRLKDFCENKGRFDVSLEIIYV